MATFGAQTRPTLVPFVPTRVAKITGFSMGHLHAFVNALETMQYGMEQLHTVKVSNFTWIFSDSPAITCKEQSTSPGI